MLWGGCSGLGVRATEQLRWGMQRGKVGIQGGTEEALAGSEGCVPGEVEGCPWAPRWLRKGLELGLTGIYRGLPIGVLGLRGSMRACACLGRYEKLRGHHLFRSILELKLWLRVHGRWCGCGERSRLSVEWAVCVRVIGVGGKLCVWKGVGVGLVCLGRCWAAGRGSVGAVRGVCVCVW